jgi:hypothetical protein
MTARTEWRRADLIFVAGLAAICGLTIAVGIAPLRVFEHDTFFALDGAFRVLRGQVPHRDFSSAWGPVLFLMDAAGLALSGLRPAGIGYANALWGALIAVWAYWIGRSRFTPGRACIAGIYTLLLIVGPYALGYSPLSFSHAMAYNRYGFALLGIILLECSDCRDRAGAFSSGVAWALLVFLKVSYAVMAVPFLLIAWIYSDSRKQRLIWLGAGAGLVTLLLLSYLRFSVGAMWQDWISAASGRSRTWNWGGTLNAASGAEGIPLVLMAGIVCVNSPRAIRVRLAVMALATLVVSLILLSTNHQAESLPLTGLAALVLANEGIARGRQTVQLPADLLRKLWVMMLTVICVAPLALENTAALVAAGIEERRLAATSTDQLRSERGASMDFEPVESSMTSETGGPAYVDALNDGLDLLRRRTRPDTGALAMDMFDPFNYLLDRRPPRGGIAAAAYNYVFSDEAHPPAGQFFGDARYILVRKYSAAAQDYEIEEYHLRGLDRVYGPDLRKRFRLVEETTHWSLWERQ